MTTTAIILITGIACLIVGFVAGALVFRKHAARIDAGIDAVRKL